MIEISGWLLVIIEQAIIILAVLTVFFYLRSRKLKKIIQKLKETDQQISPQPASPIAAANSPISAAELEKLRDKVALYEQSVKNLERFRDMFFEIKRKYEAYDAMQAKVFVELGQALPPGETSNELKRALEKLRADKERLEQHLQQVEAELDMLMEHPHAEPPVVTGTQGDYGARGLLQAQEDEIQRLKQYVVDLTLEAALKSQITDSLEGLQRKNTELSAALEILQDENQFLMDQIQALLKMGHHENTGADEDATELRKQLTSLEKAHTALQEKFVTLESEYLSLTQQSKQ